jgi:zinc finger MYM-type protein 2/3/4
LAFRKWIKEKNSELALAAKSAKPFKTDILQLSTEELNYTLCMFVKEVRKPDGDEYAPDIIFYLCLGNCPQLIASPLSKPVCYLGIQLYLYRSGRVDNIFTDAFYEKFTEGLNVVSLKFVSRLSDRGSKLC